MQLFAYFHWNFCFEIFFLTWSKLSNGTKLKKCILKLYSIYVCFMLESLNHVRHDKYSKKNSWALHGVLVPKIMYFFSVAFCKVARDWSIIHVDKPLSEWSSLSYKSWELRSDSTNWTEISWIINTQYSWFLLSHLHSNLYNKTTNHQQTYLPDGLILGRLWIKQLR